MMIKICIFIVLSILVSCQSLEESSAEHPSDEDFDMSALELPENYKQKNGLFPVGYLSLIEIPEVFYHDEEVLRKVCALIIDVNQRSYQKHGQDYFVDGNLDVVRMLDRNSKNGLDYRDGHHIFLSELSRSAFQIEREIKVK